jgi:hypothetical protein
MDLHPRLPRSSYREAVLSKAGYAEFRTMPNAFSFARFDAEPLPIYSA